MSKITDMLREASRFVRTHPDEVAEMAGQASIWILQRGMPVEEIANFRVRRWLANIEVGIARVRCNPDLTAAYCRVVADEIDEWDMAGRGVVG
jgi:hypothetical protein